MELECFQYAKNAYGPIEEFTNLTGVILVNAATFSSQDALYYYGETTQKAVFAFRGTDSFADMFADIMIYRDKTPDEMQVAGGYIHRGFFLQYSSILSKVREKVALTSKPLIFTGHSLGGALATLFALTVKTENPTRHVSCCTFGSPKVGNKAFVNAFNSKVDVSIRIVNNHDGVTYRPTFGYAHVKGYKLIQNKSAENTLITYFVGSSQDHTLASYYKSLTEPGKPADSMPLTTLLFLLVGVIAVTSLCRRKTESEQ